jgi:hypothetical protein
VGQNVMCTRHRYMTSAKQSFCFEYNRFLFMKNDHKIQINFMHSSCREEQSNHQATGLRYPISTEPSL